MRFFPVRFSSLLSLALAAGLVPLAHGQADTYPDRPITVVVAYPPGGSTDLTGRAVADQLSKKLGVPVVVENVGGAGGAIGAHKVSRAAPDGYTLLLGANNEIAINRLISPSVKYSYKDFTPIGLVASQPMVLVASTQSGIKTTDQFIKTVKSRPGKYIYGSSGVGTALHLSAEMAKQQAGLFMSHIPYRGVGPLTTDLYAGTVDFGVYVLSSGLPHIRGGKVVALGITEKKRSAVAPEIAPLADHPSLSQMDISVWFALMAPPQLPEAIAARLRKALAESLQTPEFRKKLEDSGSTVAPLNVEMNGFLAEESAKYQKIVNFANIKE
ncbi:MAG: tripartite tricarboxylate transporter substrate binding protein [Hydrogenophaga sp.]|jgi:tripartite-type tricarboxylate transporter receptor subunit TctC|uniref:Bug family tripartite tricarboxylate transporter substrate binding protein n=1 Tax=Hydrogenophaga sp. TaxID=1904254 RepID=UPI0026228DE9|nr:tripartite tricarboxylate transporter substrate binding protein [Hydrogenophaga sp.]MCW5672294.1 tripartite tricarboxylate transporter substrate binding protein [Hydrogenophaga sp.]